MCGGNLWRRFGEDGFDTPRYAGLLNQQGWRGTQPTRTNENGRAKRALLVLRTRRTRPHDEVELEGRVERAELAASGVQLIHEDGDGLAPLLVGVLRDGRDAEELRELVVVDAGDGDIFRHT